MVDNRSRGGSEHWVADQVVDQYNLQGCSFGPLGTRRLVEGESYWSPGSNSPDTQRVEQQVEVGLGAYMVDGVDNHRQTLAAAQLSHDLKYN